MRWAIWGREILRVGGGGLVKVMMDGTYTGCGVEITDERERSDAILGWCE